MIRYIKTYIVLAIISYSVCGFGQTTDEKQTEAIRGLVLESSSRLPIAGASVSIPGIASAITDDQGKFSLSKTDVGAVIQVKAPGYASQEVPIRGRTDVTVLLYDEAFLSAYKDVYLPLGSQEATTSSSALSFLDNRDIHRKATTSFENILQDGLPGLNTVLRSGAPGAGANIFLRGFNSLNASSQPLIVVDGIPFENSLISQSLVTGNEINALSGIDPKDIESITVLKDGTSIYGSKGANGVILIHMAKSKSQTTSVDFYASSSVNLSPANQYKMLNGWQSKTYLADLLSTSGLTTKQINALSYLNEEVPVVESWGIEGNEDYYRYNHDTDWQKEVFRNSQSQNYAVSVKGGDDIALYALSLGYLNKDGIVKNTNYSRYNTQFNTQINMSQSVKVNANINFSYGGRDLAYEGESPNFNPLYVSLVKSPFMTSYLYNQEGVRSSELEDADVFDVSNPRALVTSPTFARSRNYRFFQNIEGSFAINRDWSANALFGTTFDKIRENIFLPSKGLHHDDLSSGPVTNEIKSSVARYSQYSLDLRLNYQHTFSKGQHLESRFGARYQTNRSEWDWLKEYNSASDNMTTGGQGDASLTQKGGNNETWKSLSYYLNVDYSLKNKYFLSLNAAMDASSRFGKQASGGLKLLGNVFGLFPSLSGAWLVSSEDFMKKIDKINLLKLRASYGLSGNDAIGNYTAGSYYTAQNFLSYSGFVRSNIANPKLKWEAATKLNLGVDIALFNERLSLSVDVYKNTTRNLFVWKTADNAAGITSYADNDGSMQNKGIEFGLNGRLVNGRHFTWDAGITVSHYKNKVTSFSEDASLTEIANGYVRTEVGAPLGQFYGYKTNGVYATSAAALSDGFSVQNTNGTYTAFGAGDVRFVNLDNADKLINSSDMTVIGDPNPDIFGSINLLFAYRRFQLEALFSYSYGNDIYNSLRRDVESMSNYNNQTQAVINRWSYAGQVTSIPKATWGDPMGNSRFSDRWIEDGSYLRLKSLSLSYDFPVKKVFFKELKVYLTGTNLVTWTKYLGYDPEFSIDSNPLYYGVDTGQTPQPRSFTFGVKIGL